MIETYRNNSDSMPTPEYAKNWTETSPKSKLREINKILNDPKLQNLSEVKKLKNKISNREYRSFQKMIGIPYNDCDGKLGENTLKYFNNHINKIGETYSISLEIKNELSNLKQNISIEEIYNAGGLSNYVDTTHIQRAEVSYLAKHETMSEPEYNKLFSGKEKLQQGQLGDCYLVSGIHELARAQHFDTLMRTSIQRMKWNNGDLGYQIKIPLGEPSGRKILIKDFELKVAKIRGNDGYKLLELAYAKNKLRKNDKNGNQYRPITSTELKKISGGWTHEVLTTFLGRTNIGFSDFGTMRNYGERKRLSQSSNQAKIEITNFLKNYNPQIGNRFVSLASMLGTTDRESYVVGGKKIYCKHAYSLTGVKKNQKGGIESITVLNPRNNSSHGGNYQNFTLNEFFNAFSAMSCGKIKTKTFLDGKSRS